MNKELGFISGMGQELKSNRQPIPYGKQYITDHDIKAVVETLKSGYLTQGPKISEFEEAFARYVGSKYAVAVSNGTAALHLCALALEVEEGVKVITTPITFAASANCVRYCGGEVVFADIDPETYLVDTDNVRKLLEASPKGTYKGIIPVDFAGRAVNLEEFKQLADKYDLWIIEDSCHAPGGFFRDSKGDKQYCGNGNFADLSIFSFHPVKHIAAGEGGMITTNNEKLYKNLLKLRTHGITKDAEEFVNSKEFAAGIQNSEFRNSSDHRQTQNYPAWYMEMQELGYNYRLTDIQAALGLSQLNRAGEGLKRRKEIASRYYEAFKYIPQVKDRNVELKELLTQGSSPENNRSCLNDIGHAYHLYVVEVEDRLGLYDYLREKKIFAQIHYIPLYLMPYYREKNWKPGDFPHAENYYSRCISLPMFPSLTDEEQEYVVEEIKNYYAE